MSEKIVSLLDLLERERQFSDAINAYNHSLAEIEITGQHVEAKGSMIINRDSFQTKLNEVYDEIRVWIDRVMNETN